MRFETPTNSSLACELENNLRPEYWTSDDVGRWLRMNGFEHLISTFEEHEIGGSVLLMLTEKDLRSPPLSLQKLGEIKRLSLIIGKLQKAYEVKPSNSGGILEFPRSMSFNGIPKSEALKLFVAFLYGFISLVVTSISMTFVHDRVPDMQKIPPLPDIFLDNIPVIPQAFQAAEACAITLSVLFCCVIFVHKHRFTILRRYFSIVGTVFFLRALTMISTTLSVPGPHLKMCQNRIGDSWEQKMNHVLYIWTGGGMSLSGVRTCGDYMFSGHTAVLTVLNLFVCEYVSSRLKFILTLSWSLNFFGTFFVLAAHEHYTIDVIVAFYITSRTFAYYHVLANSLAHKQRSSQELTWSWFPLFSYFEENVDSIIANEYEWPWTPVFCWYRRKCNQYKLLEAERKKNGYKGYAGKFQ